MLQFLDIADKLVFPTAKLGWDVYKNRDKIRCLSTSSALIHRKIALYDLLNNLTDDEHENFFDLFYDLLQSYRSSDGIEIRLNILSKESGADI
jgi:hypothetical protein